MAHFAKLNDDNVVIDVNVVDNADLNGLEFPDSEPVGVAFLSEWSGGYTNWRQTSYNASFRKSYAAIGGTYDAQRDAFIPVKPFDSWVLNEDTCLWEAPVPRPKGGMRYIWNEELGKWEINPLV
jgi:hypothetical protein